MVETLTYNSLNIARLADDMNLTTHSTFFFQINVHFWSEWRKQFQIVVNIKQNTYMYINQYIISSSLTLKVSLCSGFCSVKSKTKTFYQHKTIHSLELWHKRNNDWPKLFVSNRSHLLRHTNYVDIISRIMFYPIYRRFV